MAGYELYGRTRWQIIREKEEDIITTITFITERRMLTTITRSTSRTSGRLQEKPISTRSRRLCRRRDVVIYVTKA